MQKVRMMEDRNTVHLGFRRRRAGRGHEAATGEREALPGVGLS